jgi:flagellar assembly protein FliH
MAKVFKPSETLPRVLTLYERVMLEDAGRAASDGGPVTREGILEAARVEAARKVQDAYAEGLRRGAEAGKAEFENSVAYSAQALGKAAAAIKETHQQFLETLEPQVVELAHRIASVVVQREAQSDPELIGRTVRRALETILDREKLVVRVNPVDLDAMRRYKVGLLEHFDGVKTLGIQADETVSPGGCFVESELMCVDARLEAQLESILDAMKNPPESTVEGSG